MADRLQTLLEYLKRRRLGAAGGILGAECILTAKMVIIDDRDDAVEFHQGILQRRRGEQDFERIAQGVLEILGAL